MTGAAPGARTTWPTPLRTFVTMLLAVGVQGVVDAALQPPWAMRWLVLVVSAAALFWAADRWRSGDRATPVEVAGASPRG